MKKRLILTSLLTLALIVALITAVAGCAGEPGLKGSQGEQGIQGEQGERGLAGPQGKIGLQGEPGPKGSTGTKGATGATGTQGIQGEQGPAGPAGAGASGPKGATGAKGATGPQGEQGTPGSLTSSNFRNMILNGALRLVETQNADGGWDWGDMVGTTSISTGTSPVNTVGVTALGLVYAYNLTGYNKFLVASELAAGYIIDNAINGERMRGPDITFLVELTNVTDNPVYLATAQAGWAAILANPDWSSDKTVTAFGNYVITERGGTQFAAWDINLYVVGLNALGYTADAVELATVTNTLLVNVLDPAGARYPLALSGAIETYAITGQFTDDIPSLSADLLALQTPDGDIDSDTQATAYTVMALVRAGIITPAITNILDFFYSVHTIEGGWIGNWGEYTEVDSEIIQAIYDFIK